MPSSTLDAALMQRLDHQFNDLGLMHTALTHRSRSPQNYERLEFLGDSILGFVVANWLFENFPDLSEGRLSRMRASLVRKETLAIVARSLDLGPHLLLGEGEMKSGGFNRDSILADTVESLIGALYLDAGLDTARKFIDQQFESHFAAIGEQQSYKDAKSKLQEAMQKHGFDLPVYTIVTLSGEQHRQEFTVACALTSLGIEQQAKANSRRAAEQKAASLALTEFSKKDLKALKRGAVS